MNTYYCQKVLILVDQTSYSFIYMLHTRRLKRQLFCVSGIEVLLWLVADHLPSLADLVTYVMM